MRVTCDACDAAFWIGPREDGADALCEACQRAIPLAAVNGPGECPACHGPLTTGSPRFTELYGELQHIEAVLASWGGDAAPLETILPERPTFITDLTPPAPGPEDDAATREALDLVRRGHYAEGGARARSALAERSDSRALWTALAIASERSGDVAAASGAWTHVIGLADGAQARLARGALLARRGEHQAARSDFARAGDTSEAAWNRAALEVLDAVATTPGLPSPERMAAARREARAPSGEWHENSVGRLLWTRLVERSLARWQAGASVCPDERVIRAAEAELEFDSFWDRALVLHGYATLRMGAETERLARELAVPALERLVAASYVKNAAAAPIRDAVRSALAGVTRSDPRSARSVARSLMERDDVRTYRVPCAACGKGSIGVADVTPVGERSAGET